ncbi:Mitochondrial thiamine pyrophosphate carrier 1 [Nakaseomyces bracarensis]|uniref:Mitochondrial thiamine pyrophosphate carrier 1 n=1 Tax=Nakaseomyces bracarensis TaxID=273131 RepID=A0ABR4NR46_9SACH
MTTKDHLRKGENVSAAHSMIAGGLSGLFARSCIAPLDTIKIKLQVTPYREKGNIIIDIFKREGVRGFWKGNVPGSLMYVVYGGVQFGSYTYFGKIIQANLNLPPQLHSAVVGSLAGMTSSFFSYPFDVLRTRFAANSQVQLVKIRHEVKEIMKVEGIRGFFTSCTSSMINISLNASIMFGVYESIKIFSEENKEFSGLSDLASPISGMVSKICTFPLDTVRRRVLLRGSHQHHRHEKQATRDVYISYRDKRFLNIGAAMVRQEGVMSLYRGLSMALVKSIPSTTISLWSYELFMKYLS